MGFAIRVYEAFKDDEVKAKVLSEFVAKIEETININQLVTKQDLHVQELQLTKEIKEVEFRLTKEIEQVRADLTKEIEKVRLDLTKEIEKVRIEGKEAELRLTREIEKLRVEIYQVKSSILKWLVGLFVTQTITVLGIIGGLLKLLR